jgi:hypothetical protein
MEMSVAALSPPAVDGDWQAYLREIEGSEGASVVEIMKRFFVGSGQA